MSSGVSLQNAAPLGKRSLCTACQRPFATCFCSWVQRVVSPIELLILQHPQEAAQTKGTARLLHACLPNSQLAVGEAFDLAVLEPLLRGASPRKTVLLYPPTPDCAAKGIAPPPALNPDWIAQPADLRLVVLDASWRKSRKMLYLNHSLQALPRLVLNPAFVRPSRYFIRKAQQAGQLSTLEAACAALAQLENNAAKYAPVLAAFDAFVAQQMARVPRE